MFDNIEKELSKELTENIIVIEKAAANAITMDAVSVVPFTGEEVAGMVFNLELRVRVKKPPDKTKIKYQHDLLGVIEPVAKWSNEQAARMKKPPDPDEVIIDDAHHGLQVSFNPPPVRIKKPPDKVCQGKQAVKVVVGVLVMRSCLEAFNYSIVQYSERT